MATKDNRTRPVADAAAPVRDWPKGEEPPTKVRATGVGYYGEKLRHPGDVFVVAHPETEFSTRWMEKVPAHTPEHVSGPQDAIDRARQETLSSRGSLLPSILTGPDDVGDTPTGDRNPLGDE